MGVACYSPTHGNNLIASRWPLSILVAKSLPQSRDRKIKKGAQVQWNLVLA